MTEVEELTRELERLALAAADGDEQALIRATELEGELSRLASNGRGEGRSGGGIGPCNLKKGASVPRTTSPTTGCFLVRVGA